MSDLTKNYITAESRNCEDSRVPDTIQINLADNCEEVRGFGQPIPVGLAKEMAKNYFDSFDEVQKLLEFITKNENGVFNSIMKDDTKYKQFTKLQMMMAPDKHIVSGVFGKEIILQTLAQKNCEGLRYIVGRDSDHKMTVILSGVKETDIAGKKEDELYTKKMYNGTVVKMRKSELLPSAAYIKKIQVSQASDPNDPHTPEVHASSLTVKELKDELNFRFLEDVTDVLFGEF